MLHWYMIRWWGQRENRERIEMMQAHSAADALVQWEVEFGRQFDPAHEAKPYPTKIEPY